MNYTYILKCSDDSLYTGWTTDLKKRLDTHNRGTGAKYTRSRLPVVLVYYEEYETKQEAMQREYAIKQLTRRQKEALISSFSLSDDSLSYLFTSPTSTTSS
ncbi:MAG: GIY-YIG nuclease family protein [Eubacteriales bacterium]|nr:GIY-YIG nuclease family protein [Eubacteriales bacterium]